MKSRYAGAVLAFFVVLIGVLASVMTPRSKASGAAPICEASSATGRVFHVDPVLGRQDGDGSALHPWASLQTVVDAGLISREARRPSWPRRAAARLLGYPSAFARVGHSHPAVVDGDTVLLHSGDYGAIDLSGLVNRRSITIAAAPGASPRLARLTMNSASHFVLRGLAVEAPPSRNVRGDYLVKARALAGAPNADNLRFEDLTVGTLAHIGSISRGEWVHQGQSGMILSGDCIEVAASRIHDVRFGVSLYRVTRTRVVGTHITGFSVDGIDFSGNDIEIAGNEIADHWMTGDLLHPDCMQGQTPDGSRINRRLRISRNICIARVTGRIDPGEYLQGISLFDGRWRGVAITCNRVLGTAGHGIAVYGGDQVAIMGNVVLGMSPIWNSWIVALPSKEHRPPSANLLSDNVATGYLNVALGGPNSRHAVEKALNVAQDFAIAAELERGFSGVSLAGNRLVERSDALRRQPPDPRLEIVALTSPIAPMTAGAARDRFSLPASCGVSDDRRSRTSPPSGVELDRISS